jgi:hypothetical protein
MASVREVATAAADTAVAAVSPVTVGFSSDSYKTSEEFWREHGAANAANHARSFPNPQVAPQQEFYRLLSESGLDILSSDILAMSEYNELARLLDRGRPSNHELGILKR